MARWWNSQILFLQVKGSMEFEKGRPGKLTELMEKMTLYTSGNLGTADMERISELPSQDHGNARTRR